MADELPFVRGIRNTGNTCFLNAVLQALSCLPAFHQYLFWKGDDGELTSLVRQALVGLTVSAVGRFISDGSLPLRILRSPSIARQFRHGDQNDAHELLTWLLSAIDEEVGLGFSRAIPGLKSFIEDRKQKRQPSFADVDHHNHHSNEDDADVAVADLVVDDTPSPSSASASASLSSPPSSLPPSPSPSPPPLSSPSPDFAAAAGMFASSTSSSTDSLSRSASSLSNSVASLPSRSVYCFHRNALRLMSVDDAPVEDNPFRGVLTAYRICELCGSERVSPGVEFFQLSLSLPPLDDEYDTCSLTDCLEWFSAAEMHQMKCKKCLADSRQPTCHVQRLENIDRVPQVLSLHIQRLVNDRLGRLHRLSNHVRFPEHLQPADLFSKSRAPAQRTTLLDYARTQGGHGHALGLGLGLGLGRVPPSSPSSMLFPSSPRLLSSLPSWSRSSAFAHPRHVPVFKSPQLDAARKATSAVPAFYRLMAVIVHHPSRGVNGGHFTTYRRVMASSLPTAADYASALADHALRVDPSLWVHISDDRWKFVDIHEVLAAQAYMLFYECMPADQTKL